MSDSDLEQNEEFKITMTEQAISACAGAIITSILITPLDVVKIRMQVQQKLVDQHRCFLYCNGLMEHYCECHPKSVGKQWFQKPGHFGSTLDAFTKIARNEGVFSLWSGLSPTLVLALPATVVYFVSYEQMRNRLRDRFYPQLKDTDPLPQWIPLLTGGAARMFSTTLVNPLELIRTKLQSEKLSYYEVHKALKALVKVDGIKGFWRGLTPTLLRDIPFSSIYWYFFEVFKIQFKHISDNSTHVAFVCGALSGSIAAVITLPFDVVKTHQQIEFGDKQLFSSTPNQYQTKTIDQFRSIYRQSGVRGFFAGLAPRLIKVAPACAIMISSFEYGKQFFYRFENNKLGYQLKQKEKDSLV